MKQDMITTDFMTVGQIMPYQTNLNQKYIDWTIKTLLNNSLVVSISHLNGILIINVIGISLLNSNAIAG